MAPVPKESDMARALPSALITDNGKCVHFRIRGRFFELNQRQLRAALGLPAGPRGLGITIDGDRFWFEFPADNQTAEFSAGQLYRRLAKHAAATQPGYQGVIAPRSAPKTSRRG